MSYRSHPSSRMSRLARRDFLGLGGVATLSATTTLLGCSSDFLSQEPGGEEADGGSQGQPIGDEAPMLAELVKAGKLPPVEERLPTTPLIVEPVDRAGVYGGQWRTALLGQSDTPWLQRTIDYEHPLTWDPEFTEVWPNLVESFEANEDGTIITLGLRQGVLWSDGEPFTVGDVIFAYDDILSNEEFFPIHPAWLSSGATAGNPPATVEEVDDYTVRFRFDVANGLFLQHLAALEGGDLVDTPRHYLEQFHKNYNSEVEALADEEGFSSWVDLFQDRADRWLNTDLPTLKPWMVEEPLGESARFIVVRNPYYWKTDPNGSQLPYLDRVVFDVVDSEEVIVLKITSGEIDMHARHVMSPRNKPVFARDREGGDYDFFTIEYSEFNQMGLNLNLTHKNPSLRQVFQTKDFRIALSHAINRDEMIAAVFQRQGEPWQMGPQPDSPFYDEQMAKQYTEYDPDRANQLLDAAGFADRDGDGFRRRPDGERIGFDVAVPTPSLNEAWPSALELVRDYWQEVGIDARIQSMDRSLFSQRGHANEHDAMAWGGEFGGRDGQLFPVFFVPVRTDAWFGVGWAMWYASGGQEGMEPPREVRRQMEIYDEMKRTIEEAERDELWREVLLVAREQFYTIGIALPAPRYGVVKNTFFNVPEVMPGSFPYPSPAPTRPEQYFSTA